jgi:hypothetical protein
MIAILLVSIAAIAQEPIAKSPFDPIRFFAGHWQGTTQGEPGHGKGERDYEFVLGGKFLRASNKTVYPPQEKNPKGEVHTTVLSRKSIYSKSFGRTASRRGGPGGSHQPCTWADH